MRQNHDRKLEVVLLQDTPGLGQRGQIKAVRMGYAQNYLFAHNLAALADSVEATQLTQMKTEKTKQTETQSAELEQKLNVILNKTITVEQPLNPKGNYYAPLAPQFMAEHAQIPAELSKYIIWPKVDRPGQYVIKAKMPQIMSELTLIAQ